jgi:hypothetical protein
LAWAKVSDDAPLHDKMFRAGITAFGFYVAGLCYCNRRLTDGRIPATALPLIFPGVTTTQAKKLAQTLVEARLWERTDDGWAVHDFHEWNLTAQQIAEKRQAKATRMDKWRRGRGASRGPSGSASGDASGDAAPTPTPTPTPPNPPLRDASHEEDPDPRFNHDCPPDTSRDRPVDWRGRCVSSTYLDSHPGAKVPMVPNGSGFVPRQCPHHRVQEATCR